MVEQQEVTPEAEVIRQQMDATRTSLGEKLEALEQKVTSTVDVATSAVAETVATVKDTVQASVTAVQDSVQASIDTVAETFDLPRQVQRHPWLMVGGSVAVGFFSGWLLGSERRAASPRQPSAEPTPLPAQEPRPNRVFGPPPEIPTATPPDRGSWLGQLAAGLSPEIEKLKGLAVGTLGGVVRDLLTEMAPDNLKTQLVGVMDDMTTKFGGEPIRGRVLPEPQEPAASEPAGFGRREEEGQGTR